MGVKTIIPEEEFILGGNRACPGCGAVIALRIVAKALGNNVICYNNLWQISSYPVQFSCFKYAV
jgi:pyruvate/2-oxoacid:ferredoxin oxidoreductase beta subunit